MIDMCQFGFKYGLSANHCTSISAVKYYSSHDSHVLIRFIDFTKVFDRVNYTASSPVN